MGSGNVLGLAVVAGGAYALYRLKDADPVKTVTEFVEKVIEVPVKAFEERSPESIEWASDLSKSMTGQGTVEKVAEVIEKAVEKVAEVIPDHTPSPTIIDDPLTPLVAKGLDVPGLVNGAVETVGKVADGIGNAVGKLKFW